MREQLPGFSDASARFDTFLREHGHQGTVVWVGLGDLALMRRTVMFHPPSSDLFAHEAYADAQAGLGHVRFNAIARTRGQILATIRVALSEEEAADHWIHDLTLSIRDPLTSAVRLPSRALLSIAQRILRHGQAQLPFLTGLDPYIPLPLEAPAAV